MNAFFNFKNQGQAQRAASGPIPADTILPVVLRIRKGGFNDVELGWTDDWAKQAESGAVYLDCEFTVVGGAHAKRKFFSKIGLRGKGMPARNEDGGVLFFHSEISEGQYVLGDDGLPKGENKPWHPNDTYAPVGHRTLMSLVNSASGKGRFDSSEEADAVRGTIAGFADFDGMVAVAKIGIETYNGKERNTLRWFVDPHGGWDGTAKAPIPSQDYLDAMSVIDGALVEAARSYTPGAQQAQQQPNPAQAMTPRPMPGQSPVAAPRPMAGPVPMSPKPVAPMPLAAKPTAPVVQKPGLAAGAPNWAKR